MERVSLFVDMYNFVSNSAEYLNQKSFIDFSKFHQYFISDKQIFGKTYLYGGTSFGKMLDKLEKEPRIDVIRGEVGKDGKEKGTDINLAIGMLTKAFHNSYDVAILFSGDRDYIKLVRQLRRMGKIVYIAVPAGQPYEKSKKLINESDGYIILDEEFYKSYWLNEIQGKYISKINSKVIDEVAAAKDNDNIQ
jgi:uncharacterized LabA/DUF88 family protein